MRVVAIVLAVFGIILALGALVGFSKDAPPASEGDWVPTTEVVIRPVCTNHRLSSVLVGVKPGAQGIYTFIIPPTLCQEPS